MRHRARTLEIHTEASWSREGAVSTEQRVRISAPVVEPTLGGAQELGRAYWDEVEGFLHGLVRIRAHAQGPQLTLGRRGPVLLRFGPAEVRAEPALVACRYPIEGGLLARAPGGSLTLAEVGGDTVELRSSVTGFHPRLGARPGFPAWTGGLYTRAQARLHDAIGRRFLARLAGSASR
jgi:hypothetical protein